MKQQKNDGITLIGLVITIIVLLILAGVSIAMLTGENGILTKASEVKGKSPEIKAKEEIQLVLNEWQIEKRATTKTIEEFFNAKVGSKEIDKYEIKEDGEIEIYRDNYYVVINNEGEIKQEVQKFIDKTEATYEIISTNEVVYEISILFENQIGIQSVLCPNGTNVNGNNQNSVVIDTYSVESNKTYEFRIQTQEEVEFLTLEIKNSLTQEIAIVENDESGIYPTLYADGIKVPEKTITIQYPEDTKGYYSKDNGTTWSEYSGEIVIDSDIVLKAKYKMKDKITPVVSKNVSSGLAPDALGMQAYNGNLNDCFELIPYKPAFLKVDSSAIGKRITIYGLKRVNSNDSRHFIYFYSSEGNLLTSSDLTWVHQNNGKPNSCNSFKYFTISLFTYLGFFIWIYL